MTDKRPINPHLLDELFDSQGAKTRSNISLSEGFVLGVVGLEYLKRKGLLNWEDHNAGQFIGVQTGPTSIAHIAAQIGDIPALDWLNKHNPDLLYDMNYYAETIVHYAAEQDRVDVLEWIKKTVPALLEGSDFDLEKSIGYKAAYGKDGKALAWLGENYPQFLRVERKVGRDAAYSAIEYGRLKSLEWINQNMPELLDKYTGRDIMYNAIRLGKEGLDWVEQNKPQWLDNKTLQGMVGFANLLINKESDKFDKLKGPEHQRKLKDMARAVVEWVEDYKQRHPKVAKALARTAKPPTGDGANGPL